MILFTFYIFYIYSFFPLLCVYRTVYCIEYSVYCSIERFQNRRIKNVGARWIEIKINQTLESAFTLDIGCTRWLSGTILDINYSKPLLFQMARFYVWWLDTTCASHIIDLSIFISRFINKQQLKNSQFTSSKV